MSVTQVKVDMRAVETDPGDDLAEYDAVGKDVGAVVVPAAAQALRRHPPRRPHTRQPISVTANTLC